MLITPQQALKEEAVFIDTRTPKEYEEAHIPNAINIPLFGDEERALIGTMYKQQGPDVAIKKGFELVLPKLGNMLKKFEPYKNKKLIIYCWRGGMRSKSVTEWLKGHGYNAVQLEGGHKAYRNYILEKFKTYKIKPKIFILHGLTGAGKTEILQKLKPMLDLEDLAQHRSSMFGWVNLKPRTQKMFDSLLFNKLEAINKEPFFVMEGESRKIGTVQMPDCLWNAMKKGINIKVECSKEARIKRLVEEYRKGPNADEDLILITNKLRERLSNKVADELIQLIQDKDYEKAVDILLDKYYDPLYNHTVEKFEYRNKIYYDKVEDAIKEISKVMDE